MTNLTLSVFEIVILFLCATVIGFVIHFFITTRRNLNRSMYEARKGNGLDEWKVKYFNDMEVRDKEMDELKKRLQETADNNRIYQVEAEELRKQNKRIGQELETAKEQRPVPASQPAVQRSDYVEQLIQAQENLALHSQTISKLLSQVDVVKETEEKISQLELENEELTEQVRALREMLNEKEEESKQYRQKENLAREMNSILDTTYNDFGLLQEKIRKLETQLSSSRLNNMDFEDMKESHYKITKELEDHKSKLNHFMQENHNMRIELTKTEDKLNEANLQRQQLQKKVAYLEEMNRDLQQMSETNKKLEGQLKRIGELESMLNLVAEERDKLKDSSR